MAVGVSAVSAVFLALGGLGLCLYMDPSRCAEEDYRYWQDLGSLLSGAGMVLALATVVGIMTVN